MWPRRPVASSCGSGAWITVGLSYTDVRKTSGQRRSALFSDKDVRSDMFRGPLHNARTDAALVATPSLRYWRVQLATPQHELARLAQVSRTTVSRLEAGRGA